MNRGTLRTLASSFCVDPNQTLFTAAQYNTALDLANQQFAMDSKALYKDASTITVVDGTSAYDLPTDFMYEKKVTHKLIKLDPISRETLEFYIRSEDWTAKTGTPMYFVIDPEEARKQIKLFPIPQGGDAGANLILTYYPFPAAMTADSDTPLNSSSLMVQFHIALACYAAWLLLNYKASSPDISEKRRKLLDQYNDKVTEATDTFGNTKSEPLRLKGGRFWR